MCQITLNPSSTTVLTSSGGNATSIQISGTVRDCKFIKFTFTQNNIPQSVIAQVNFSTNPASWTAVLNGVFACGTEFKVDAICTDADGVALGNCQPVTFTISVNCPPLPKCCLDYNVVVSQMGGCNANNERQATFTVNYNVTDVTCLPYVLQLDFGDSNSGTNHIVNTLGSGTFTETHYYNANTNGTYNVILSDILHGGCPPKPLQVIIESCMDNNPCCPGIGTPVITFGNCDNNCRREVIITTPFTIGNGVNCRPVVLQWDFGNGINSQAQGFNTAGSNSFIVSQYLDPNANPYTATLNIVSPVNTPPCPPVTIQIPTIPQCTGKIPPCPEIMELTADMGDCDKSGKRKVIITAKIKTFGSSCSLPTEITINYGNGDSNSQSFQGSGIQTVQWTYYYTPSNTPYTIQLLVTTPSNCNNKEIQITVPNCDVIVTPDTPSDPPTICPCCILLIIAVTSYYLSWALGWFTGNLTVLGVNLGAKIGYASSIFAIAIILIIFFCFKRVASCRKCWDCRFWKCMFYALILSLIIIIVIAIIYAIYGTPVLPLLVPFITALLAMITAWLFFNTDRCKNFFNTGKCQ